MSNWRFKEIVVLSALAVVFGVVYLAFLPVGTVLAGIMGPIGFDVIYGVWFMVSIVAAYIIRKPGAAFVSETIAALVEVLIGSTAGPMVIVIGIIQGIGAEAAFAATKWKRYSIWVLMAAGVGAALTSFVYSYFKSGYAALATNYVIAMLVVRIISGALISGLAGKALSDGLAKTGVLSSFALGKEYRKKNAA